MPLWLFELACIPVLATAIALSARRAGARTFAVEYALLAVAGYLGEESCIRLYDHYHYALGWHARVGDVPLLVPLIWPLVILSAREVRTALFPGLDPARGAFAVFALVALDASMVEVVAVRAELWSWAEPGHLGVPILGILGWGFFAGAADLGLSRWKGWQRVLVVPFALAVAHALIVVSWWACFRWTLRGDLGVISFVVLIGLSILAAAKALELRRVGRTIPLAVALPRVIAASLFFALLITTAPLEPLLWLHVVAIAVPYILSSEVPRRALLPTVALLACACAAPVESPDASGQDAGTGDARAIDAGPIEDGAVADGAFDATALDAARSPLRDDALLPDWPWIEKARAAMDHDTLDAAFAAEGWAPPAGSEIYAARIVPGADVPAYVLFDAGGGAFSEDFWPASTVKVLSSIAALTYLNERGFTGAAMVTWDSGFGDIARSIVDRAIRVSSNEDYDRTLRIAGLDYLNDSLLDDAHGFPGVVIQRSYAGFPIRDIPGMTIDEAGRTGSVPARTITTDWGCGANGNCASLFELSEAVRRVILDDEIMASERFAIDATDTVALTDALCGAMPSFFAAGVERALGHPATICHKPGWVPGIDCLDHGVVSDPVTGDRWLLAVSVPETAGRSDCLPLADVAEHVIGALRGAAGPGMPLQLDGGVAITIQRDSLGGGDHALTIEAEAADSVEVFVDRSPIATVAGASRFSIERASIADGEHLVVVRAFAAGVLIGARAARMGFASP